MTTYGYRVTRSRVEMICDVAAQVIMIYLLSFVITISDQSVMHERFSCIWHVLRQYDDIKREHCSSLSDVVNNQSDQCFIPFITNTPNKTSRDSLISWGHKCVANIDADVDNHVIRDDLYFITPFQTCHL